MEKKVFLIRHAESMENEKMGSLSKFFKQIGRFESPKWNDFTHGISILREPSVIDTELSQLGKVQVDRLSSELKKRGFLKNQHVELVVHSPLIRAKETCAGVLRSDEEVKYPTMCHDSIHEKYLREWIPGHGDTSLTHRITEFSEFIAQRKENTILVVGHSQYFRRMLGMQEKFRNCDLWQVTFHTHEKAWKNPELVIRVKD